MSDALARIIADDQLVNMRKPLEEASVPPLGLYTDEQYFEQERDQVLRRTWHAVGREEQVREPGEYFTCVLLGEALIIVKDKDGEIRALSNVCRHRGTQIADGCGRASMFVCPYHSWTYRLDGTLQGARWMDRSKGFDKAQVKLPQFRVELWNGFIFVNFAADVPPLAPQIDRLTRILAPYKLHEMRQVDLFQREGRWNWKVSLENFTEAYHHIGVHAKSIGPAAPADQVEYEDTNNNYSIFYVRRAPGTRREGAEYSLFPPVSGLPESLLSCTPVVNVYPTFHLVFDPGVVLWLSLDIRGVDDHTLRWKALVPPQTLAQPDFEQRIEAYKKGFLTIIEEDMAICAKVRKVQDSQYFEPGRYCYQEKSLYQMHQWLLDRMGAR